MPNHRDTGNTDLRGTENDTEYEDALELVIYRIDSPPVDNQVRHGAAAGGVSQGWQYGSGSITVSFYPACWSSQI